MSNTSYLKSALVHFLKRAMMGSQRSVHLVNYTIQFKTDHQIGTFIARSLMDYLDPYQEQEEKHFELAG